MNSSRTKNSKTIFLLLLLISVVCGSLSLAAQEEYISIEFHIAADPCEDNTLVKLARNSKELEVRLDSSLVAKWVPFAKNAAVWPDSDNTALVTRPSVAQGREILVLITDDDITGSQILELNLSKGQYGESLVQVKVDNSGSEPGFYPLTENKIGRYIVAVVDGQALNAIKTVTPLYEYAVIPGAAGEELAGRISSDKRFVGTTANLKMPMSFNRLIIAAIISVFSLLFLGLMKLLSRKKPAKSKSFRLWIVIVTIMGIVAGAYFFGVCKSWGSMQMSNGQSVIARRIEIRLVDVFVGALAGGTFSYLMMHLLSLKKSSPH